MQPNGLAGAGVGVTGPRSCSSRTQRPSFLLRPRILQGQSGSPFWGPMQPHEWVSLIIGRLH